MFIADALSRLNTVSYNAIDLGSCDDVEIYVQSIVFTSAHCDLKEQEVEDALSKDNFSGSLFKLYAC